MWRVPRLLYYATQIAFPGALRVGPGWQLVTHLSGCLQDSTFVQDLVSLIKKRAPMQTYR